MRLSCDQSNPSQVKIVMDTLQPRQSRQSCWTRLFLIAALCAAPILAAAQSAAEGCALARDPVRCLARTEAIAACADLHGEKKHDCLLIRLPPPDCSAAPDSRRCQREQDAREACKGREAQALRTCLHDQGIEAPKKSKSKSMSKKKPAAKKKPANKKSKPVPKAVPKHTS